MPKSNFFESTTTFTHGTMIIQGTIIFVLATVADMEKREGWIATIHSRELEDALATAKKHVEVNEVRRSSERSDAYLLGWMHASTMNGRANPYPKDSADHIDYELGYTESLRDDDFNGMG